MDELHSFGAWLRRRRRALDVTQDALARQVGYTAATEDRTGRAAAVA